MMKKSNERGDSNVRPDLWKRLVLLLSLVITLGGCQSGAAESPTASLTQSITRRDPVAHADTHAVVNSNALLQAQ